MRWALIEDGVWRTPALDFKRPARSFGPAFGQVEPDGIEFDLAGLEVAEIREGAAYPGLRGRVVARLGPARITCQVDVGFGDALIDQPVKAELPTLLDLPAPELRVYPVEALVAEKIEAIVRLGEINTRLKDYFDLYVLATELPLDAVSLSRQFAETFERRGTPILPQEPVASPSILPVIVNGTLAGWRFWIAAARPRPYRRASKKSSGRFARSSWRHMRAQPLHAAASDGIAPRCTVDRPGHGARAVSDTNVLVSALGWRGPERQLYDACRRAHVRLFTSPKLLDEGTNARRGRMRV